MIREATPLPRRPRAESKLLDTMLQVLRFRHPMGSDRIVRIVKKELALNGSDATAIDIRMMLGKLYFKLTGKGWVCTWRM